MHHSEGSRGVLRGTASGTPAEMTFELGLEDEELKQKLAMQQGRATEGDAERMSCYKGTRERWAVPSWSQVQSPGSPPTTLLGLAVLGGHRPTSSLRSAHGNDAPKPPGLSCGPRDGRLA